MRAYTIQFPARVQARTFSSSRDLPRPALTERAQVIYGGVVLVLTLFPCDKLSNVCRCNVDFCKVSLYTDKGNSCPGTGSSETGITNPGLQYMCNNLLRRRWDLAHGHVGWGRSTEGKNDKSI